VVVHFLGIFFRIADHPARRKNNGKPCERSRPNFLAEPVNALLIRGLLQYYLYYGNDFRIECPTGSGRMMNLYEVAREIAHRLAAIFLRDASGRRPVFGSSEKFQNDPHWRDFLLFYEYFHGDNGAGIGASHQTGWTGLIAKSLQLFAETDGATLLKSGHTSPFTANAGR
jgi:hypothetical protein